MASEFYITRFSKTYNEAGLAQSKLWEPDTLCMTIAGENTAETGILRLRACFPDSVVGFVADPAKADVRFVKYMLDFMKSTFRSVTKGATQDNLSLDKLLSFHLPTPSVAIQKQIADILSAYDDLIENNTRRIQLLERMAQAIYREWFVHFRFPGHEKVKLVDSPIGKVPFVWSVSPLGKLVSFLNRGISPVYAEDGETVVINQKCIRDQRIDLAPARRQSRTIPAERFVRFGDVLINSTGVGTLGRVAQVYGQLAGCTVDTHVTIVRAAADLDIDFFGCAMCALQKSFERLGVGATGQTELARKAIEQVDLLVPSTDTQAAFGRMVRPIRTLSERLLRRIAILRRTRDLLLPKLISGALDVSDLDIETL